MVNTRQFSGSTYMQDMTKSHTFSAKNQGSTYTPRNTVHPPRFHTLGTAYLENFWTLIGTGMFFKGCK